MPFCPRCRMEYNVGVERCLECKVDLVLHRPRRRGLLEIDTDELLVPLGAFFCLVVALGLYGVSMLAQNGQLPEPLGPMIAQQPVCMTVFYAIAGILSGIILVVSVLRWMFDR